MVAQRHVFLPWLLAVAAAAGAGRAHAAMLPGVVVESIASGSPAERAGIRPGDILLRWETLAPARRDAITSTFAHEATLQGEESRRGAIRLHGTCAGTPMTFRLEREEWRIQVRPNFTGDDLARYLAGKTLRSKASLMAPSWIASSSRARS